MRCIRCGTDSRLKERADGKCAKCGQRFALEPARKDPVTDGAFQAALTRVSPDRKVKFTAAQLHHQLDRYVKEPGQAWLWLGRIGLVGAFITFGVVGSWWGLGLTVMLAALWWWRRSRRVRTLTLRRADVWAMLRKWEDAYGPIQGLIRPRKVRQTMLPEELLDYSFDRAVITDTAETAEVLIANDFHFENSCAVLSITGYPEHAFDTLRKMIRSNEKIEVFALHDCTREGCRLAQRLAEDPEWFKGIGRVTDVGLRPGQAEVMKLRRLAVTDRCPSDSTLTEPERVFLSAWEVELAALTPEQLIKRLFKAIHREPQPWGADGGGADPLVSYAVRSDGGGDAFG